MIKMILIAILVVTMSTGFAEAEDVHRKTRAPRIVEYREPGGLFTPLNRRFQSEEQFEESNQRPARQQESPKVFAAPAEADFDYKPFNSAPTHIKNLIYQAYQPQEPYVDPHSFFYKNYVGLPNDFFAPSEPQNRRSEVEEKPETVSSTRSSIVYRSSYSPQKEIVQQTKSSLNGGIKYRQEGKKPTSTKLVYGRSNRNSEKRSFEVNEEEEEETYDMPVAIQTLLQYQSQIPYHVLANQINFEAKKPFVPQPLPEESKSAQYPSKIFYIKADGSILDEIPAVGIKGGEINYKDA